MKAPYARLLWVRRRIASMSPAEIGHRALEQLNLQQDRRRTPTFEAAAAAADLPVYPGLAQSILTAGDGLRAQLSGAVEALLSGRFEALGVEWPARSPENLFPAEVWRLDPVTGRCWPGPDRFSPDIGYRHQTELGSIKYVWEYNRLQFLQPLAAHYLLTKDGRALVAIEAAINGWLESNPPFRGINWNSGIELGVRAVSLTAVSSLCGEALSQQTRSSIRTILAASAYWLKRYPSLFSSANNHLVTEAMGLFVIASLCPDLAPPGSASNARAHLEREALLQVLPDGIGAEQSPTYAAFTVEAILTTALLARRLGQPFASAVDERLERFGAACAWLCLPDGRAPAIGDDDEGEIWRTYGGHEPTYAASVARAVAGYLGRSPPGPRSGGPSPRDAIFSSPSEEAPAPQGVQTFSEGGYTVVRERRGGRDLHLILDHGPLGYLSIAAHGHADAGTVIVSIDGQPVLVDAGTFMYHADDDWRSWFRGTRAHNTVSVADANQSLIAGPFLWSHRAVAKLDRAREGEDWSFELHHDGYRGRFGVDHRRTVSAAPDGFIMLDRLEPSAKADLPIEVVLQFAPGLRVDCKEDGALVHLKSGDTITVSFDAPGRVGVKDGEDAYDGGWVSPRFGRKEPAPRLSWRGVAPHQGLSTRVALGRD